MRQAAAWDVEGIFSVLPSVALVPLLSEPPTRLPLDPPDLDQGKEEKQ